MPMSRETQRKGDIAKAQAILDFTRMGFDVSVLITESAHYDLIVDDGEGLHRVQVKYCGSKRREVPLRNIHSNSLGYVVKTTRPNSYDWLYVMDSDGLTYIKKECLSGRNSIMLSQMDHLT